MAKNQSYELDENGNLRKKGFLSSIYNFGYYYKSYIIVALVAIAFGVVLYFSIQTAQADMYLFLVTSSDSVLTDDNVNGIFSNVDPYVEDFDDDGAAYFVPEWLRLTENTDDAAHSDLEKAIEDVNVICFAVDDYAFAYLKEKGVLRDLAFFGLEGIDEHRLKLNGTAFMKDIETDEELYLVMKYVPDEKYEDYFISLLTSSVVDMTKKLTA